MENFSVIDDVPSALASFFGEVRVVRTSVVAVNDAVVIGIGCIFDDAATADARNNFFRICIAFIVASGDAVLVDIVVSNAATAETGQGFIGVVGAEVEVGIKASSQACVRVNVVGDAAPTDSGQGFIGVVRAKVFEGSNFVLEILIIFFGEDDESLFEAVRKGIVIFIDVGDAATASAGQDFVWIIGARIDCGNVIRVCTSI